MAFKRGIIRPSEFYYHFNYTIQNCGYPSSLLLFNMPFEQGVIKKDVVFEQIND